MCSKGGNMDSVVTHKPKDVINTDDTETIEVKLPDAFTLKPKTQTRITAKVRYMGRAPFRGAIQNIELPQ